jgi:hypothetical protein
MPIALGVLKPLASERRDIDEKDQLAFFKIDPTACGQARRLKEGVRARPGLRHDEARIDLLFTMSDNTHPLRLCAEGGLRVLVFADEQKRSRLVEPDGIEPTTSCLQSRRSPS